VPDEQLEALLQGGWRSDFRAVDGPGAMTHLDLLSRQLREVRMDAVRPALADAIRQLRAAGLRLSDRRIVKAQRLIGAAAVLAGRLEATRADLWPLRYVLPTQQAQLQARDVLKDLFAHAEHPHLRFAVEDAAMQPLSRVGRLLAQAQACLARAESPERAAVEGVLREIDANFAAEQLPAELAAVREQLLACVRGDSAPTGGATLQ
jgi:MoxR-like ATPase